MKITVRNGDGTQEVPALPGDTLLAALRRAGTAVNAPCGGHGTCGKCTVYRKAGAAWEPVPACRTLVQENVEVRLPEQGELLAEGASDGSVRAASDAGLSGYGVACDIGTTTVVCCLVDLSTGEVVCSTGEGNAQRPYGHDVISRIQTAVDGGLAELAGAIRGQLARMIEKLCLQAAVPAEQISRMAVAANPTMCHLLAGLPPDGLGHAPFTPVSYFGSSFAAHTLGLPLDGEVYIAPSVSGFVGGDITAGMLASNMDRSPGVTILMDVGTNGEIVLGHDGRFVCCSTAAGPAFEGAQLSCGMTAGPGAAAKVEWRSGRVVCDVIGEGAAAGICGSGFLDAAAMLLGLGAVDETGRMLSPSEGGGLPPDAAERLFLLDHAPAFRLTESVFVTQADIRKLQLGKGAIAAGLQVLLDTCGIGKHEICRLLLAGGFGSRLRPESAARIGLIPRELLPVAQAVGNAAIQGASAALISSEARAKLDGFRKTAEYLELSTLPAFNSAYMDAMLFPEEDAF